VSPIEWELEGPADIAVVIDGERVVAAVAFARTGRWRRRQFHAQRDASGLVMLRDERPLSERTACPDRRHPPPTRPRRAPATALLGVHPPA
jgi:hypothetical protein